nr:MAG TPA: hypothetical protein [Caudoviricetes sp.]DAN66245.1 MAG TPA: hypothetical protein [Caudoviricetes sp.]
MFGTDDIPVTTITIKYICDASHWNVLVAYLKWR